ncbi:MAG: response regulator [Candidatus Kerfeldbacteria bacterium]|nr:response regulator [Candidatus Kerfeldbacteria bacterium]
MANSKTKILLVEDDAFLAGMYVTKMNLEDFEVVLAGDGEAGLEQAQSIKPDIILLDVILPKMSGFDVLKNLKSDPKTKNIPVLMLTNLGQQEDVQKGLAIGAVDYLIKAHFMPAEVVEKVKSIISKTKK